MRLFELKLKHFTIKHTCVQRSICQSMIPFDNSHRQINGVLMKFVKFIVLSQPK